MKQKQLKLKDQISNYLSGMYDSPVVDTQIDAGWYDWFCKDSSLAAKTDKLYKKVIQLLKSKKIDLEKHYVFFKNNCPMVGNLYDDFRICELNGSDVVYTIIPGRAEVWGKENNFDKPLVTGTWKDVKKFFLA